MKTGKIRYDFLDKARKLRALAKARVALAKNLKGGADPRMRLRHVASKMPIRGARDVIECHPRKGDPLVLKVYAIKDGAQVQFDALAEVSAMTDRIVKPLFNDAALGVCATEWAGDTPLNARLYGSDHDAAMAEAGRWLAAYHRETLRRSGPLVSMNYNDSLSRMRLRDPSAMPENAAALHRALERQITALGAVETDEVAAHFDFNPRNLANGPQGLKAYDRPRQGHSAAEVDICRYLAHVIVEQMILGDRDTIPPMSKAFLDAYAPHPDRLALVQVGVDRHLLQWWMSRIFGPTPNPSRQATRRVILDRLLARYNIAPQQNGSA